MGVCYNKKRNGQGSIFIAYRVIDGIMGANMMRKHIIYTMILALNLCSISCVRTEACSASVFSDPQATGKTSYRKKHVKMKVVSVSKKKDSDKDYQ